MDTIRKRGPFNNPDKLGQLVDNALQMLKSGGVVLNYEASRHLARSTHLFIEKEAG